MRLIDADALKAGFNSDSFTGFIIQKVIEEFPTIATMPVAHGRWVEYMPVLGAGDLQTHCSECGLTNDVRTDYCPNCGAKMDGGE